MWESSIANDDRNTYPPPPHSTHIKHIYKYIYIHGYLHHCTYCRQKYSVFVNMYIYIHTDIYISISVHVHAIYLYKFCIYICIFIYLYICILFVFSKRTYVEEHLCGRVGIWSRRSVWPSFPGLLWVVSADSALPLVQGYLLRRLVWSYPYIYIHPCGYVGMYICINVGVYVCRFSNIHMYKYIY
jgi:hypothetical protein